MFRNVWFLTTDENSFTALNTQTKKNETKKIENHFIPENALFYTQSLNTPLPNSLIPIHPFYQ